MYPSPSSSGFASVGLQVDPGPASMRDDHSGPPPGSPATSWMDTGFSPVSYWSFSGPQSFPSYVGSRSSICTRGGGLVEETLPYAYAPPPALPPPLAPAGPYVSYAENGMDFSQPCSPPVVGGSPLTERPLVNDRRYYCPYRSCTSLGRQFSRQEDLQRHEAQVHGHETSFLRLSANDTSARGGMSSSGSSRPASMGTANCNDSIITSISTSNSNGGSCSSSSSSSNSGSGSSSSRATDLSLIGPSTSLMGALSPTARRRRHSAEDDASSVMGIGSAAPATATDPLQLIAGQHYRQIDDSYHCLSPSCEAKGFRRLTDLRRHVNARHFPAARRLDCSYRWCGRYGESGFTRRDHLVEHLREVHKADIPKRGKSKSSPSSSSLPSSSSSSSYTTSTVTCGVSAGQTAAAAAAAAAAE